MPRQKHLAEHGRHSMALPMSSASMRGVAVDAVPEILQPQVFVGGMLVVVVIGDGQADHGYLQHVGKHIERHAAAHHGHAPAPARAAALLAAAMTALPTGADRSARKAG